MSATATNRGEAMTFEAGTTGEGMTFEPCNSYILLESLHIATFLRMQAPSLSLFLDESSSDKGRSPAAKGVSVVRAQDLFALTAHLQVENRGGTEILSSISLAGFFHSEKHVII